MSDGLSIELKELIALKRHVKSVRYQPESRPARQGNHVSKLRGRGMDFAEVRNYQAGDEIRHMEWRVTARTGRPHIKLYQEELERPAIILLDFNASLYFGTQVAFKSVVAAQLAALIAWTANAQGDRVGGLLFSSLKHHEFNPKGRAHGVLPMLAALSDYTKDYAHYLGQSESEKSSLSRALIKLRRVVRPGSMIVLISDFYTLDQECERHLAQLRAHNDILVYQICDPIELAPPKPQQYGITDGQRETILDTANLAVREAYENFCQEHITQVKKLMQRLSIQSVTVTSQDDLPRLVRQTYPRRTYA